MSARQSRAALAALLLLLPAVARGGRQARTETVERRLALMGTGLVLEVAARDRATALAASEQAVAALEAAEARLSTWREDTELARLNRAPAGEPFALSPALAADLAAARRCWEETGGAFDPTVGPLVRAWGLREGGRAPSAEEIARARAATGMAGLRLDAARGPGTAAVRERADLLVEEGGFGKGAGLRDAVAALRRSGATSARLDLGGQVALLDGPQKPWEQQPRERREQVAVADPRRRERPVVALAVAGGSVSTSGNSERGIVVAGERLGHLLDPRTGRPAPDFGSLTVWADDPLRADCLSTGLYVLGPAAALAWADRHPDVAVLALVPRGGRLAALASANLRGRLLPLAPEVEIEYGGPGGK